jgi:hypothetical protein
MPATPDKAPEAATALMVQRNQAAHAGIRRALENVAGTCDPPS